VVLALETRVTDLEFALQAIMTKLDTNEDEIDSLQGTI
jgi:hypothetical protein